MLSVIVPAYNVAATITEQLAALEQQQDPGVPWEVLVVDNASTDETGALVRPYLARHPTWRSVLADREHNLAYVRNVGVDQAAGEFIAFADGDDVVSPGWAKAVVRALTEHPLVAFRFDYARLNEPAWLAGRAQFQSQRVESIFGVPVVGGPMGVRRDVWQAVGGNDEAWHFTGEDFDFALRVGRDLGIEPSFAADALYHYRLRGDVAGTFRQARRYGRGHAAIFARYVERPGPLGPRARAVSASWWWVASRAPVALSDPSRRLRWARIAGVRLGRTVGSLLEGRLAP